MHRCHVALDRIQRHRLIVGADIGQERGAGCCHSNGGRSRPLMTSTIYLCESALFANIPVRRRDRCRYCPCFFYGSRTSLFVVWERHSEHMRPLAVDIATNAAGLAYGCLSPALGLEGEESIAHIGTFHRTGQSCSAIRNRHSLALRCIAAQYAAVAMSCARTTGRTEESVLLI